MSYARINWKNYKSGNTPLNEVNLNYMDNAISELFDMIKNTSDKVLIRDLTEVATTEVSVKNCIYIDSGDKDEPIFKIGDGDAYIIDLPELNIIEVKSVVDKLRDEAVTAKINGETLLLPYIFERV